MISARLKHFVRKTINKSCDKKSIITRNIYDKDKGLTDTFKYARGLHRLSSWDEKYKYVKEIWKFNPKTDTQNLQFVKFWKRIINKTNWLHKHHFSDCLSRQLDQYSSHQYIKRMKCRLKTIEDYHSNPFCYTCLQTDKIYIKRI